MPRRSRSRIAASEWQAGPMVQMILARRATGDKAEVSAVKEEFSVVGCGLLDFISSSTCLCLSSRIVIPACYPSLLSRAKRAILLLASTTAFQGGQAKFQISPAAR